MSTQTRITSIMQSEAGRDGKVRQLRQLYADTRALQRAATESPMGEEDRTIGDLQLIEKALETLDAKPEPGPQEQGAATL